jgi:hypothetical protein
MEEFLGYLLGDLTLPFVFAFMFFVMLGQVLVLTIHYKHKKTKEVKKRNNSSFKFNWSKWKKDNFIKRIIFPLVFILSILRFWEEIWPILSVFIEKIFSKSIDLELGMWAGFLLGVFFDMVIVVFFKIYKRIKGKTLNAVNNDGN